MRARPRATRKTVLGQRPKYLVKSNGMAILKLIKKFGGYFKPARFFLKINSKAIIFLASSGIMQGKPPQKQGFSSEPKPQISGKEGKSA